MPELTKEKVIEKAKEYYEKWYKIGTKVGPATKKEREACEKAILECYHYAGKEAPKNIIWVRSPREAMVLIDNFEKIAGNTESKELIRKRLSKTHVYKFCDTSYWGQWDSYWIAFYLCGEELGCKYKEEERKALYAFADIAKVVSWWWPFTETCIVSQRPTSLYLNEQKQLHADLKPAMRFADGLSLWFLNGIKMEEWMITTPVKKLNGKDAMKIQNADVRREFIRKIGMDKFVKDTKASIIDTWKFKLGTKIHTYELMSLNLGTEHKKCNYLRMSLMMKQNKRYIFVEGVPNTITTAEEAFYSRYPYLQKKKLPNNIA